MVGTSSAWTDSAITFCEEVIFFVFDAEVKIVESESSLFEIEVEVVESESLLFEESLLCIKLLISLTLNTDDVGAVVTTPYI